MSLSNDRRRRPARGEAGQSVAEFALIAPVLLIIVLGLVEVARAYDVIHSMTGLGREAANIAVRGEELDAVVTVTMQNGDEIRLAGNGGVIASRVVVESGIPVVREQVASDGYVERSRVGLTGFTALGLDGIGLVEGQTVFAVEVFYDYRAVTPLKALVGAVIPEELYERAVF